LALPLCAGCNPASRLIGTWQLDADKFQTEMSSAGNNPLAGAMAQGVLSMMKFDLQLEFKADGGCAFTGSFLGQSRSTPGTWRYVRTDGDALVLMIKTDEQPAEREVRVKFVDHDRLETIPPVEAAAAIGPKTLSFKRVKAT
jgi:hypothetical protein